MNLIPFSHLQNLAEQLAEELHTNVHVEVGYWAWNPDRRAVAGELRYSLFINDYNDCGSERFVFERAEELKAKLISLLGDEADRGIGLEA